MIKFHSNEPNCLVYYSNCGRSFSKVNGLQRHYNREHNKETDDADEVKPGIDYDEDVEPDFDEGRARSDLRCHVAEFLFRTKEHAKITQTTLDMV